MELPEPFRLELAQLVGMPHAEHLLPRYDSGLRSVACRMLTTCGQPQLSPKP